MLSYRHAFHAGNHADVLKHVALLAMLRYLAQKETPLLAVDTHAGGGRYVLDSPEAQKLGEFREGIGRIWQGVLQANDAPPAVADYLASVRELNPDGVLRHYPGSPWLMRQALRRTDSLRFFELHSKEARTLARHIPPRDKIRVAQDDGLTLLKSLLPPPSRRALVFIDPSYEVRADYAVVLDTLRDALRRFSTGVYAVWYPRLARLEARQLPERLRRLGAPWLDATLDVRAVSPDGLGMYGSGLFVLNPPWTLAATLRECLPWLAARLGEDAGAGWNVMEKTNDSNSEPDIGRSDPGHPGFPR
ncbi:MAG: 23S rRNA (adenine(2030)-N(6))-methyltransferase RlmJ [Zoogloeaceae bacterium]|jgi:23S rRNA (adenine2030-N6)-methyltransferase|nr:23S rRNA (adenine(2030)-N(6))-methyltransferase RlmJ [Zoogloeaceae bacterium]